MKRYRKRWWLYRKKLDSKRRWLARYKIGKFIPREAVENTKGLARRLAATDYQAHRDGFQKTSKSCP